MVQILAIIGILGGVLCAIADCLLDIKGADNEKISKYIESNWEKMSSKRFYWSTILAMFAIPMDTCGFLALMMCLYNTHQTLSLVLGSVFFFGAMGGIMIHTCICLAPTICKVMLKKCGLSLTDNVLETIMKQISVPFFTQYIALVIIPSIAIMVIIIQGLLPLPLWCILLNPVVFQLIGLLLKATKCKFFVDVPSVCAVSLGASMYGVLVLMLI